MKKLTNYPAPFAVFLNKDDHNYVEPDISVICDKNKLDERGCNGAPDWVIEYRSSSVREYWIVNPMKQTVQIYSFEGEEDSAQYSFSDEIPVYIYNGLTIQISKLLNEYFP